MPSAFTLREPSKLNVTESPLGLNDNGYPMFECARILAGSVDIWRKSDERLIKPRQCYLSQKTRTIKKGTLQDIVTTIYGESDIDIDSFARNLRAYGARNRDFWTEINAELCHLIEALYSNRPVDGFLYLYRVHERVSVALPLIYAHSETDFSKALDFMKSLSGEERDGELTVFKSFVSKYFSRIDIYRDLTVDIEFGKNDSDWGKNALSEIKAAMNLDQEKNARKFRADDQNQSIEMDFIDFPVFLVSFRNRLFHYTNSIRNLNLDKIGGTFELCSAVVPPILYCLSQVIAEIIRRQVRN